MRLSTWLACGAGVLVLAGCSGDSTSEYAEETGDGASAVTSSSRPSTGDVEIKTEDGTLKIQTGKSGVAPAGFALYPGAEVSSSSSYSGTLGQANGSVLSFETEDSVDDVIEFYRKQIESKGLKITSEVKTGDLSMIAAKRGENGGINVTASRSGEDVTNVMLAANEPE